MSESRPVGRVIGVNVRDDELVVRCFGSADASLLHEVLSVAKPEPVGEPAARERQAHVAGFDAAVRIYANEQPEIFDQAGEEMAAWLRWRGALPAPPAAPEEHFAIPTGEEGRDGRD